MKIAILSSGLLPIPASNGGAIETLIDDFILTNEKYHKYNIDVYSIPTKKSEKKYVEYIYINNRLHEFCIKVINKLFHKNIPINYFFQKKMIKKVNSRNYDFIILENYPELVLKLNSDKIIEYVHSDVLNKSTKKAKEIIEKCYKIITVSDYIKDRVIESFDNDKTFTVYNCIDFNEFDEDEYKKNRRDIRNKYDIDENDIVFVYSGRLSPEKGVLEAVKAFSKTNLSNAKLLIIGGIWYGCNKINDYFKQLKEFSNSNVIFTGYVLHNEIEKYLCASDIGLVPSICNEAAGLSVVEFMARKNLVIASNRGGIKEYMNSQNVLIDFDSTDELIDKMRKEMKNISVSLKERNDNLEFSKKFSKEANYLMIASILGE